MWRYGWDTPPDYTDNQLFCGGKDHENIEEHGKCGICGDPYDEPQPRTHEIGGPYYKGYLVQNYTAGSVVTVVVNITANHKGFFQFKICKVPGFSTEATQDCLDKGILTIAGTDSTDYYITTEVKAFYVDVQLPQDLECEHCVFQWRYHCGNSWGTCPNGTEAEGCGPQEEFYGCADVSVRKPGFVPESFVQTVPEKVETPSAEDEGSSAEEIRKSRTGRRVCSSVSPWNLLPGMDDWCRTNCLGKTPFCPRSHCKCTASHQIP